MAVKASATVTLSCYRDTQSVTRYYKLQSSTAKAPSKPTTNPPPNGWDDTEPSYTSGSTNTLYFCDLTVFSDGTWTYSSVSKSSSYEAAKEAYNKAQNAQDTANSANDKIDGLEIGGRNLARETSSEWSEWWTPSANTNSCSTRFSTAYLPTDKQIGDEYTVSLDVEWTKFTAGTGGTFTLYFQGSVDDGWTINNFLVSSADEALKLTSKVTAGDGTLHVSYTKTVVNAKQATANKFNIGARCNYSDGTGQLRVKNIKVEKGNKATDWTPAPEDVDDAINTKGEELTQTITEQCANVQTTCEAVILDALKSYTETSDFESFKKTVSSQLSLMADNMTVQFKQKTEEINKLNDDLSSKFNTITKYFTFDVNGLTIGQSDSPYKVIIDNDRYSMTVDGTEVMWIANGKVYTPEIDVTKVFRLFGYMIDQDANGNVNCGYVGG